MAPSQGNPPATTTPTSTHHNNQLHHHHHCFYYIIFLITLASLPVLTPGASWIDKARSGRAFTSGKTHYPRNALQCHSTLTQPGGKVICPQARNHYCVKEVTNLAGAVCGTTQYFGDRYDKRSGACVYRKCADTCSEGRITYEFEGQTYYRDTYCCTEDLCNGSSRLRVSYVLVLMVVGATLGLARTWW